MLLREMIDVLRMLSRIPIWDSISLLLITVIYKGSMNAQDPYLRSSGVAREPWGNVSQISQWSHSCQCHVGGGRSSDLHKKVQMLASFMIKFCMPASLTRFIGDQLTVSCPALVVWCWSELDTAGRSRKDSRLSLRVCDGYKPYSFQSFQSFQLRGGKIA